MGYHIVNITIHIITSLIIFLIIIQLLELPKNSIKNKAKTNYFIALLSASLWAGSPIQTQAVTYIIQRMASLAALFYLLAIFCYIIGRKSSGKKRTTLFILCFLTYILAIGSKENAIVLPLSLILIEFTFFQNNRELNRLPWKRAAGFAASTIASIFLLSWVTGANPLSLVSGYESRSFTLIERVLTEPRILVNYLVQLFLPLTSRLSIEHQLTISTSLFYPITTLPSIIFILSLCCISILHLRRYPLISFPIIFFFLNHLVESTVLPLELIFEHRNYLPSAFIFLPFSFLVANAIYTKNKLSNLFQSTIIIATICYLTLSGLATYTRNSVWRTEGSLWNDALYKAPSSARAAHNLGRWYREQGDFPKAIQMFNLAYTNSSSSPTPERTVLASLNGMASICYILGEKEHAISLFNKCLEINPTDEACLKNISLTWILEAQYKKAFEKATLLAQTYPNNPEYLYTKGFIAMLAGKYIDARKSLSDALSHDHDDWKINLALGVTLKKLGAYKNAIFFIQNSLRLNPKNIDTYLYLAETYIIINQFNDTKKIIEKMLDIFPINSVIEREKTLNSSSHNLFSKNLTKNFILITIKEKLFNRIDRENSNKSK